MKTIFTLFLSLFITTMFSQNTGFTVDVDNGCYPLTVNFTNNSSQDPGDYFIWEFNDGTTNLNAIDGSHIYNRPGNYDIILRHYNYADNEIGSNNIHINVIGVDSILISTGADACIGEKVWFTPYYVYEYTDMYWVLEGDTSGSNHNISHVFDNAGTYEIKLFLETVCGWDSVFQNIEITNSATPIVDFNTSGSNEICINDQMTFYSQFPSASLLWDFDDGSTDTIKEPTHIFTNVGGKNVTLTVTNICGNSASKTKQVNVRNDIEANAEFSYDNYNSSCPNTPIDFFANYTGNYYWTFDTLTTSTAQNPTVLFSDTGYYNVQLILTNGCGNVDTSKIDTVHVIYDLNNRPEAHINFDMNNSWNVDTVNICPGQEVSFGNYTYPVQSVDYIWYFGDGDTSVVREPTHIFSTTSEIMLIAQNQCMGKDTARLWVNIDMSTQPSSVLGVLPDSICPGENVYFIDYQGENLIDNNYNYYIDFGDGQTLSNPSQFTDPLLPIFYHEYENLGVYNYIFSTENLCGNTVEETGTISVLNNAHVPNQYLVYNPTDPNFGGDDGCPNDSIIFMAFGGASYEWHFGDGLGVDTGRVVYYAYADTGIYNVYVIVTTNCGNIDTLESTVNISGNNLPDIYFDIEGNGSCAGDTVHFVANDHGVSSEFYTYNWFVDGDSIGNGLVLDYVFDYGGDVDVKLETTNGCGTSEVYRHIFVNSPKLSFSVNNNIVVPNENIIFTNTSSNATTYTWDFGDGNTSTQTSPTHSYADYGYYDITLSAINSAGCSQTETWSNYILVSDIQINATVTNLPCNGYEMQTNYGSINLSITGGLPPYTMSCQEDVSNGYMAIGQQLGLSFAGMPAGTYHIDIVDANGTQVTKTYIITEPNPINIAYTLTDETCYKAKDGKINLYVTQGTAPYTYSWSEDLGISGTYTQMPNNVDSLYNLTTENPVSYKVTVTDANGCVNSIFDDNNDNLQLQEASVFYSISMMYPDCESDNSNITIGQEGLWHSISVIWDDAYIGAVRNDLYAGVYAATVTDDVTGCSDEISINLSNNTAINAVIDEFTDYVCTGDTNGVIKFHIEGGTGAYTYQWSSNVLASNIINETFLYHLATGNYDLTVTDINNNCIFIKTFEIKESVIPELFFIANNPSCYGEYTGSAEVNLFSDDPYDFFYYNWSNGSTDNVIINRNAGTYTVTVTSNRGCSSTGSVTLENPPQLTIDMYTSNITTYGADNGVISVLVNNGTPMYEWSWSSLNYTGNYADNLSPGEYFVTLTDVNGCSASGSAIISEPAMIPIAVNVNDTLFCNGQTTNLEAPYSSNYTYSWSTGETSDIITVGTTGTYTVTVSDGISIGIDSAVIQVVHPYSDEKICMVTVDTSSMYNVIMWNKTENVGITEYKIYKLFGTQYLEIGSQPFDDYSVFVDSSSQPNVHADRYKISIVDTCGNESDLSPYHQTMYLGISDNTIGGNTIVILDWDEASVNEGAQAINWYYIYRGDGVNGMSIVDSISGVFTGWNDNNALSNYYYRVAYKVDEACYPSSLNKTSGGPYNQSVSNIDDYLNGPTDIDEFSNSEEIQIYPNPFFDKTRIYMPEDFANGDYSIKITDISGKRVLLNEKVKTKVYTLYRNNLPNGIYFVEIKGDKIYRKKLIIN